MNFLRGNFLLKKFKIVHIDYKISPKKFKIGINHNKITIFYGKKICNFGNSFEFLKMSKLFFVPYLCVFSNIFFQNLLIWKTRLVMYKILFPYLYITHFTIKLPSRYRVHRCSPTLIFPRHYLLFLIVLNVKQTLFIKIYHLSKRLGKCKSSLL